MKVVIIFCLTFSSPNYCSFQQDFIRRCLAENPADRPTARDLLLHPSLFEVLIYMTLTAYGFFMPFISQTSTYSRAPLFASWMTRMWIFSIE